ENATQGALTQTRTVAGSVHRSDLRLGTQKERGELGVHVRHPASQRNRQLVQGLAQVAQDVPRLVSVSRRGSAAIKLVRRERVGVGQVQKELVRILSHTKTGILRVSVQRPGRLPTVDVVDVEVEVLLLVDEQVLPAITHS